jgi:beta-N-acetylhexosaminidase
LIKMKFRWLILVILIFALTGCVTRSRQVDTTESTTEYTTEYTTVETTTETTTLEPAQVLLNTMTLREKVGQLFIVIPEALSGEDAVTAIDDSLTEGLKTYPVGGVVLFSKNITEPTQLKTLLSDFHQSSAVPLFLAVDEEGGRVARVAGNSSFDVQRYDGMAYIGEDEAYSVGKTIGAYLAALGFNLDFAPVADVNTNPNNPVIGDRAFSSNAETVSEMVKSAVAGFHDSGVMTCLKHFPGHGDTATDSHYGCAVTNKTLDEMMNCELIPFKNKADMVMVGHITTPNATLDGLPASLSYTMITEVLRNSLGHEDTVVVTDSMSMRAITDYFTSDKAAVLAIKAGADIVLMPWELDTAYEGVLQAIETGEISEQELNEHVLRILRLKYEYGLIE